MSGGIALAPCGLMIERVEAGADVGMDDFARRRSHRYDTIIVDFERRRIVDILADREAGTVAAWLAQRPSIRVIARDRGAAYRQVTTQGRRTRYQPPTLGI